MEDDMRMRLMRLHQEKLGWALANKVEHLKLDLQEMKDLNELFHLFLYD